MSGAGARRRRTRVRRTVAAIAALALALALALIGAFAGSGRGSRAAAQDGGEVAPQSDGSVPAQRVIMFGSSTEVPGEAWGVGEVAHEEFTLVRYADAAGWSRAEWDAANGQPARATEERYFRPVNSPLTGEMTPSGAGALLGAVATEPHASATGRQVLLVHNRGGAFQETPPVPESLFKPGEQLLDLPRGRAPLLTALDEGGGKAGALLVPVNTNSGEQHEDGVLHWDGSQWTREQIELPESSKEDFRVLAIGASSPGNAWLLGQLARDVRPGAVALFHRVPGSEGGPTTWRPVSVGAGKAGEPLSVNGEPFTVVGTGEPPVVTAPLLTVSEGGGGLWLDGETHDTRVTAFFKPEGDTSGTFTASWCRGLETEKCTGTLPDELPTGPSRSIAWADSSGPYGGRVITGLPEGVTLRLEGSTFVRVLGLGGGSANAGAAYGAAFAEPRDGWLGAQTMPVHLTTHPSAPDLTPYPVPFHHALLAVAPQPEAPLGALSSQALAVGNEGEVARYLPGEGWQPESLLTAGGGRATPRLRAIAWPTSTRAYAVGDLGQMWLWRGETGLWEPDPATPRNFRGNLLGIAFDPSDPSVGYAVGQGGVLLRFGKSWTQEALPPEVQGASFTSVAFAGSEALVAFRKPEFKEGTGTYTGGLLVNTGSGWAVDPSATAPLRARGLPWAVAGLPDGGAAISGQDQYGTPLVIEREGPGAPWTEAPPYPGFAAPSSLALFREGGRLRAVGAGAAPNTSKTDFEEPPAPPGFPPDLVRPYPVASGYILRQTASGWGDQQHDLAEALPTAGEWANYDLPFKPDPSAAVLVSPDGGQGWAVGGEIDPHGRLDTALAARYPAESTPPPGFAPSPVQVSKSGADVFAIGGGAQCAAPCADRAEAGIGPDVWLSSAIASAAQIQSQGRAGAVNAFIYTGPRVTGGEHLTGNNPLRPPYEREFARYAALASNPQLPTLVVPSATDRAAGAGECMFRNAFAAAGFSFPFHLPAGECASEQSGYYEEPFTTAAGTVRVLVLDDATGVARSELEWLREELAQAAAAHQPAIAVGNGDLAALMGAEAPGAGQAVALLAQEVGGASAYFYDSPGRNIALPLRIGGRSVPAFGSGTLGYANAIAAEREDYTGHSGFLLAEVDPRRTDPRTNRVPVATPRLIPNIGELALEAKDGVLLRRSQPALFAALARRPHGGCVTNGTRTDCESGQYIPIPANCVGNACATAILPDYSFSSSRTDIGNFVAPNTSALDPHAVLLNEHGETIPDASSGLFCAYNPGTTTTTIKAGGLSASLTVTVQPGSVRRPCGTVPSLSVQAQQAAAAAAPPPPTPAPAAAGPTPSGTAPLVPVPPPPVATAVPPRAAPPPPPPAPLTFVPPIALAAPVIPFVPPPVPTPARPTPPSGTSAVTSPVEVAQEEEEEEEAPESVSNQAVAYRTVEHEPAPEYILGLIVLAALAGAAIRRPRRDGRTARVAPATLSAMRAQRRAANQSRVTRR